MTTMIANLDPEIRIMSMSPPLPKGKWVHHSLPAMDSGYTKHIGYESPRCTIEGYFPRSDALRASLVALTRITVADTEWGTADWFMTNITFTDGASWIRFTCNLIKTGLHDG